MVLRITLRCQCTFFDDAKNSAEILEGIFERKIMAARLGVEPRQNESESFVLPLHHRAGEIFRRSGSVALGAAGVKSAFAKASARQPSPLESAVSNGSLCWLEAGWPSRSSQSE